MKNKLLALVEIAIVCSMLLVATLPAIAAEQNQTTQKVSTTASEDDLVLDIYGNANEDDTIDMRDVTYTKLIIFGKKPETELADAYHDGEVDVLDVVQIKLIILGRESELTLIDSADRIVTVKKPVKRVITFGGYDAQIMYILKEEDKIVGIADWMKKEDIYKLCMPRLIEKPAPGNAANPDYEKILELNPDLLVCWHYYPAELAKKLPDSISVVALDLFRPSTFIEETRKLAYILGREEQAEHYINDFYDKYMDLIKDRTKELSEEKRPKVYWERNKPYETYGGKAYLTSFIEQCGGRNIFSDTFSGKPEDIFMTDPEVVVKKNPDIIFRYASSLGPEMGYGIDDPANAKALMDSLMERPELALVNAVKNERIYVIYMGLNLGILQPVGAAYTAKILQPDLFKDLDPQAIHQELLTKYVGAEFDVTKHGVFIYHPTEYPDGR